MKQIRIGNDIAIDWQFFAKQDGERVPYNLTGRDIDLILTDPDGEQSHPEFSVEENTLTYVFLGKDQSKLGKYTLTLVENGGEAEMVTVDSIDPFQLVARQNVIMKESGAEPCGWCGETE